jgi:hypothetical protein
MNIFTCTGSRTIDAIPYNSRGFRVMAMIGVKITSELRITRSLVTAVERAGQNYQVRGRWVEQPNAPHIFTQSTLLLIDSVTVIIYVGLSLS